MPASIQKKIKMHLRMTVVRSLLTAHLLTVGFKAEQVQGNTPVL